MKFIIEVGFPLEPFSTYVREGTAEEKVQSGRLKVVGRDGDPVVGVSGGA